MTRLPPAARERWLRRVFPLLILAGIERRRMHLNYVADVCHKPRPYPDLPAQFCSEML